MLMSQGIALGMGPLDQGVSQGSATAVHATKAHSVCQPCR
jgi:hypothetical protein